jgi:hypothetical protein
MLSERIYTSGCKYRIEESRNHGKNKEINGKKTIAFDWPVISFEWPILPFELVSTVKGQLLNPF